MSQLTIYFSTHHDHDPKPLLDDRFQNNFDNCNTFIMENAEQWQPKCCNLESQYNRLSNNAIDEIIPCEGEGSIEHQKGPCEFEKVLRDKIHCSERNIMLEHSPEPYFKVEEFRTKLRIALKPGLEEAVKFCKSLLQDWAANMNKRDNALLDLIREHLNGDAKVFVFRGGAHEKYLSKLLNEKRIPFTPLRFCQPTLEERVLLPLTVGEQLDETDMLRWLYIQVNGDFEKLMEKAEAMDKKQLEFELTALSNQLSISGLD